MRPFGMRSEKRRRHLRRLRIFGHISLEGVMQASADENNFSYIDWSAAYRTPAGREMLLARYVYAYRHRCQFLTSLRVPKDLIMKNQS